MLQSSKKALFILLMLSAHSRIIPMGSPGGATSEADSESEASIAQLLRALGNMGLRCDHNCPGNHDIEQIKVDMGMLAAKNGDLESLKSFIDSSNVNKVTRKITPLTAAVRFAFENKDETKYLPLFEYLLAQGAAIQTPSEGADISPLGIATTFGCSDNFTRPIEILLERGGNAFTSCTTDTTTAAQLCIVSKYRKDAPGADSVLKLFQQKATNLAEAIECACEEKIAQFANPISIKEMEQKGKSPLRITFGMWTEGIKESLPIISILFTHGLRPEHEMRGYPLPGYTLLAGATNHALAKGDTSLLELCLSHNANPRYKPFPMAPSAIDITKVFAHIEPNNPNIAKVRALLNSNA